MKQFIVLFLCASLFGCVSQQKRCERFVAKYPACFKNDSAHVVDTLIKVVTEVQLEPYYDTNALNEALKKVKDTCITKETVKEILKTIPVKIQPYELDNEQYHIKAFIKDNKISVVVTQKPIIRDKKIPLLNKVLIPAPVKAWQDVWRERIGLVLLGAALLAIILVIKNGGKKQGNYYV